MEQPNRGKVIEGSYSKEEFTAVNYWTVTEKFHGMNMRVMYDSESLEVWFGGRTDNALIPARLMQYMTDTFTHEKMTAVFDRSTGEEPTTIILYGEGYGAGINKGGVYQHEQKYILFDVKIGNWWLLPEAVVDIARQLGIDSVPVIMTHGKIDEIVDYVKGRPKSLMANNPDYVMEGIVATSNPLMLFRDGKPLKFKLKVKDFE